ncbi:MAG: hypothetical protein Q4G42_01115 [Neisseria sp.]|nr:hypothetical protein [Neisseria sp.]
MKNPSLFLPLTLIIIGAIWFLRSTDILPPTAILLAAALAIGGVAVLVLDGINKQSVVSGPFLIYCGVAVYLYSQMMMGASPLIALGMMVLGLLMLLSRSSLIPSKKYELINPDA